MGGRCCGGAERARYHAPQKNRRFISTGSASSAAASAAGSRTSLTNASGSSQNSGSCFATLPPGPNGLVALMQHADVAEQLYEWIAALCELYRLPALRERL